MLPEASAVTVAAGAARRRCERAVAAGRERTNPPSKWMTALDSLTAAKAAGAEAVLGGLSPKNLLLIFAA